MMMMITNYSICELIPMLAIYIHISGLQMFNNCPFRFISLYLIRDEMDKSLRQI